MPERAEQVKVMLNETRSGSIVQSALSVAEKILIMLGLTKYTI